MQGLGLGVQGYFSSRHEKPLSILHHLVLLLAFSVPIVRIHGHMHALDILGIATLRLLRFNSGSLIVDYFHLSCSSR